jgi:hypothetical protein
MVVGLKSPYMYSEKEEERMYPEEIVNGREVIAL